MSSAPGIFEHIRTLFKQSDRFQEQVVEVHGVRGAKRLFVGAVELRRYLLQRPESGTCILGGGHHTVFRTGQYMPDTAGTMLLRVNPETIHQLTQNPLRIVCVVNTEIPRIADPLPFHAHEAGKDRMKRAHPQVSRGAARKAIDAVAHLASRLVCERQRKNLPGSGAFRRKQIRNPVHEHPGFAGTRAGHDKHRPLGRSHRFLLRNVQAAQNSLSGLPVGNGLSRRSGRAGVIGKRHTVQGEKPAARNERPHRRTEYGIQRRTRYRTAGAYSTLCV